MVTSTKSESIICHIWNKIVLLTEKSLIKLTLRGKERNQKVLAGVPGTVISRRVQV